MPLQPSVLGASAGRIAATPDARWTMAYAAGVPDERPELYDTLTPGGPVVHPLFPVAVEWQLVVAQRSEGTGLRPDEVRRGIHIAHDLVIERPLAAGVGLAVEAQTIAVGRRRAGATQTVLFTARDESGAVVWRTQNTWLFLGVELQGDPAGLDVHWPPTPPAAATEATDAGPIAVVASQVRLVDAHVYSECARIWNPIHTDLAAARAAGLERPILHGTATLARAVSICTERADVPITDVRRVTGEFRAPVPLGSNVHVRLVARRDRTLAFDVVNDDGTTAIAHGTIGLL